VIQKIVENKMQKVVVYLKKQHEVDKADISKLLGGARKKEDEQEAIAINKLEKIKVDVEKRVRAIDVS
jgi:hypothetical protein